MSVCPSCHRHQRVRADGRLIVHNAPMGVNGRDSAQLVADQLNQVRELVIDDLTRQARVNAGVHVNTTVDPNLFVVHGIIDIGELAAAVTLAFEGGHV